MEFRQWFSIRRVLPFLGLLESPVNVAQLTPTQVDYHWIGKRTALRVNASVVATATVVSGLLCATPTFSLADVVLDDRVTSGPSEALLVVLVMAVVGVIFWALYESDPMSNRELLRGYISESERRRSFFTWLFPEVRFYATEILPSGRLHKATSRRSCFYCGAQNQCTNRLYPSSRESADRWAALLRSLPSEPLNEHLRLLQKARMIFYVRYGAAASLAVLIVGALVMTGYARFMGNSYYIHRSFWILCLVLVISFLAIGFINSASRASRRGIWGMLKENVDALFDSLDLARLYDPLVCKFGNSSFSFRRKSLQVSTTERPPNSTQSVSALALVSYLDRIVIRKLCSIAAGHVIGSGDRTLLISIVLALEEFLGEKFRGAVRINADLYLLEGDRLMKMARRVGTSQLREVDHVRLDSDRPVALAVKTRHAITAIDRARTNSDWTIGSAFYFPLIVDGEVLKALAARDIDGPVVVGALAIESDNEYGFLESEEGTNTDLVAPFATRLTFEVVSRMLSTAQGPQS